MRLTTLENDRQSASRLNDQMELLSSIQAKISSGNKLINSSDDPVLARSIKASNDYMDHLSSYTSNIVMGINRTKLIESSVTGSMNAITRASDLIKAAQSDTTSNQDRASMANELQGILNTLESQINTKDADGKYLFSGMSYDTVPYSLNNGTYQYNGSTEATYIETSDSTSLTYQENGLRVFGEMKQGNGTVIIQQGVTPNAGTAETSVPTITNAALYNGETFTLTFVTNSANETAYQVVGSVSGQVIPPLPATTPANAPAYQSGTAVSFNGINFTMQGTPVVGDSFTIQPSSKENVLETLRKTISLLNTPINNDVDKAAFHQQIGTLSEGLTTATKYLSGYLSEVGYRSRDLDTLQKQNETEVFNQKEILTNMQSADQAQLISDYYGTMNSLKYTQEAYTNLRNFFEDLYKNIIG